MVITSVNSCRSVARRGLQLVHVGAHLIFSNGQASRQQADQIRQPTSLHLLHILQHCVLRRLRTSNLQDAPREAARRDALEQTVLVRNVQGLDLLSQRYS